MTILGTVVTKASGAGVAGLVITAYASDLATPQNTPARVRRLGSTTTDDEGRFDLDGPEAAPNVAGRAPRWDLRVTVEGPSGTPKSARPLLLASESREDAGNFETFRFVIPESDLATAGIDHTRPSIDEVLANSRINGERRRRFDEERSRRIAERLRRADARRSLVDESFRSFIGKLSSVPPERRRKGTSGYLPPGADVAAENLRIIRATIAGPLTESGATAAIALGASQLYELRAKFGSLERLPREEVELALWPWKATMRGRIAVNPTWKQCGPLPADDCVKLLEGQPLDDATAPGPPPEPPVAPVAELLDIAALVHKQADPATPPESPVAVRPNVGVVQENVDSFELHSGPADGPSLFDFHHLRIAFQPVWTELFDSGMVDTARELYTTIAEAGEDPNKYLFTDGDTFHLDLGPGGGGSSLDGTDDHPPEQVTRAFEITQEEWNALEIEHQEQLKSIAQDLNNGISVDFFYPGNLVYWMPWKKDHITRARRQGERIISYARSKVEGPAAFDRMHQLMDDLSKSMKAPYRFNVYAANNVTRSVNFGVVVNYRQRWDPVSYQVGELVKTIPLAPKEVRKFTKRTVVRSSRSEKEVTNSMQSRKTESSDTWRTESEIVAKASAKTNFQLNAKGGFNIGIAEASGSTGLGHDTAAESQEVKKQFHEAVFKAAEEYRQERTVTVEATDSLESTNEETGEIANPNDEIPVTYLFYELQRRFLVSEEIRSVTPVVLVAQEFPNPSDIDDDWIVAHDWVLRRSLLDDSFSSALTYLATRVAGDEKALQELFENLRLHRRLVEELKDQIIVIQAQVASRYTALERAIARHADAVQEEEDSGGIIPMPVGFLTDGSDVSPEAAKVREEAARDALERAAKEEKEMQARLDRATTALASITDTHTKQLSEHLNRRAQIARLRVHIKQNIFYYMQAIWSQEPTDQRFFRLHDVEVPRLVGTMTYSIEPDPDLIPMPPDWEQPQKLTAHCELDPENLEFDALGDVADLDDLLGFKGNLMMFPLRRRNDLTDFMMTSYYDNFAQLIDPDPLGNWTLRDFISYFCCLKENLSKDKFEAKLPGLLAAYRKLKERGAADEEVIVPTNSLYIEALPGAHPVLEDFKLLHRGVDVKKVMAEVRAAELDNVRLAARLLAGEREDPSIEKTIVVEGGTAPVVIDED